MNRFKRLVELSLQWPNEIPIAGEPADVVSAVEAYNEWLQGSQMPKLLFFASPGALVTEPVVDWCRGNLSNLTAVDLGHGIHFVQEDSPHLIGSELARWYEGLQTAARP